MPIPGPSLSSGSWRAGTLSEIAWANAASTALHPDYPEEDAVFEERQRLFPSGFLVFEIAGELGAYAVAHPWHDASCPSLNALIGAFRDANVLHVHDVGILVAHRSIGVLPSLCQALDAAAIAVGLHAMQAVAVGSTRRLWRKFGFRDLPMAGLAPSYGSDASWMRREIGD